MVVYWKTIATFEYTRILPKLVALLELFLDRKAFGVTLI